RARSDERFTVESVVREVGTSGDLPALAILLARDDELAREINVVDIAPGPRRLGLARLLAAAASGDQHLQRVLSFDPEQGRAILETLVDHGEPVDIGTRRRRALRVCQQLGSALGALHDAGLWHGRVARQSVRQIGELTVLTLVDALVQWAEPSGEEPPAGSPADDVAAVLSFCELRDAPEGLVDGRALARWASEQLDSEAEAELAALRERLLSEALERAPAGLSDEGEDGSTAH
ncbi:MAG: hypothetical protein KC503_08035, partial [Myxococcales bacterium]|nr:hypothetical protein [Myxococcales bacterium]